MKKRMIVVACFVSFACATPALAEVVLTPRFTGYFDNATQRQSGLETVDLSTSGQAAADATAQLQSVFGPTASLSYSQPNFASRSTQVFFPMVGSAVSFSLDAERRSQVTASLLYGQAHASVQGVGTALQRVSILGQTADDIYSFSVNGRASLKRIDAEMTFQHRLDETFSLLAGARYERLTEKIVSTSQVVGSQNVTNLINSLGGGSVTLALISDTGTTRSISKSAIYSARMGGAAYIPIGASQKIYVNGLLQFNYAPSVDVALAQTLQTLGTTTNSTTRVSAESSIGPDISVGYIRQLGSNLSLDIRYRGLFYFPVSGSRSFDDPRVNHGLSMGVSVRL